MRNEIHFADDINGCKALALAIEGWLELAKADTPNRGIIIQAGMKVLWIEDAKHIPIAVLTYTLQEYDKRLWIWEAYVKPAYRRRGLYRRMFLWAVRTAKMKGMLKISGGVSPANAAMIQTAKAVGRDLEYSVYTKEL